MEPVMKAARKAVEDLAAPAETCSPTNEAEVLRVLQAANAPMTAYAILRALRSHRTAAPTTVYRALSRLLRAGTVHRLESINAYVTCRDCKPHQGPNVFAICGDCGRVDELADVDLAQ